MNIKVIVKKTGQAPRLTVMENKLESFQKAVGGYIEVYPICNDICIICNEEGKILGLPENMELMGEHFAGDVIFVGMNDDEFIDIPCNYETFRRLMPDEWWHTELTESPVQNEDKQGAVMFMEQALKFSRYRDSIKMLELSEDNSTVFIHYENGASKSVCVECDSVVAMIKDIACALLGG